MLEKFRIWARQAKAKKPAPKKEDKEDKKDEKKEEKKDSVPATNPSSSKVAMWPGRAEETKAPAKTKAKESCTSVSLH